MEFLKKVSKMISTMGMDHIRAYMRFKLVHRFISHKVFSKIFCRSQLPHKSVNVSFTITNTKNKLTNL